MGGIPIPFRRARCDGGRASELVKRPVGLRTSGHGSRYVIRRKGLRDAVLHVRLIRSMILVRTEDAGKVLAVLEGAETEAHRRSMGPISEDRRVLDVGFKNLKIVHGIENSIYPLPYGRVVLEDLVGSRTKVRILRLLCAHPSREYTLRELSQTLGQSLGATVPALRGLMDARIVVTRRVGRSRTVRLNERHSLAEALKGLFREETEAFVRGARAFAEALPPPGLRAVVLFGSAARGEASARSDVDVLVVVDDPRRASAVRRVAASMLDRFDAAVSPLVLTEGEVNRRLAAFDPLLETIAAEGRLLRGRAPWLGR